MDRLCFLSLFPLGEGLDGIGRTSVDVQWHSPTPWLQIGNTVPFVSLVIMVREATGLYWLDGHGSLVTE